MNGDGKVAVHRWFVDGENWATHPWFGGRERQLMAALASQLRATTGEFAVTGLGGTLIGETVPDVDCPDPKARTRHPTILRAVFVSHLPTDRERKKMLSELRRLNLPAIPGANTQLEIRTPNVGPVGTTDSTSTRKKNRLPMVAAALIIGLGLVATLIAISQIDPDRPSVPTTSDPRPPTPPKTSKPVDLTPITNGNMPDLVPVGGEVPYLKQRTSRRFVQAVGDSSVYDHPYVVFLNEMARILPDSAPSCKDSAEVRQALHKLHQSLQPGEESAEWDSSRLRKAIDEALNYDRWRQKAGRRVYRDRAKPLDATLRRFVETLRMPDPELTAAATAMAELLETWGESNARSAATRQPFATIDHFLNVLTRPASLPAPWNVDHPHVAFLRRLPVEAPFEGQTMDDTGDVAIVLRQLLARLDRDFVPSADRSTATVLIKRIGEQMDYEKWLASREETFRDSRAELPPDIKRVMKRFEH